MRAIALFARSGFWKGEWYRRPDIVYFIPLDKFPRLESYAGSVSLIQDNYLIFYLIFAMRPSVENFWN